MNCAETKPQSFAVRDERRPGHHWADNEVMDIFGSRIGPVGYAIYMYLGRHSDNSTARCTRTQNEIAATFKISRERVRRHIPKLVECGLIHIEEGGVSGETNTYVLVEVEKHRVSTRGTANLENEALVMPHSETHRATQRGATSPKTSHAIRKQNSKQDSYQDLKPMSPLATTDTRRNDFIEDLRAYREHLTGPGSFQPTSTDLKNLDGWLKEHPTVDRELFRRCLNNRAHSVRANQLNSAQEIYRWIGRVLEFSEGPLDRFGNPLDTSKGGKHGSEKTKSITTNITEALERRRAGRVAGSEARDTSSDPARSTAIS